MRIALETALIRVRRCGKVYGRWGHAPSLRHRGGRSQRVADRARSQGPKRAIAKHGARGRGVLTSAHAEAVGRGDTAGATVPAVFRLFRIEKVFRPDTAVIMSPVVHLQATDLLRSASPGNHACQTILQVFHGSESSRSVEEASRFLPPTLMRVCFS